MNRFDFEKINSTFNEIREMNNIIWGVGKVYSFYKYFSELGKINNYKLVDSKKGGSIFDDEFVFGIDDVDLEGVDNVIITPSSHSIVNEIKKELCERGFKNRIIELSQDEENVSESVFCYELVQNNYKKLEKIIKKKEKIRIGYIASQKELWNLQSFTDAIKNNTRYSFSVLVMPNFEDTIYNPEKSLQDNYDFFVNQGLKVEKGFVDGKTIDIEMWNYDIVFFDQPGELMILEKYYSIFRFIKNCLVCYVPYGFKVVMPENGLSDHFDLFIHNICWKIFAESSWHGEMFSKIGSVKGKNVVVSGYPKFDDYYSRKSNYRVWKNQDKAKARIIWAPHWSFGSGEEGLVLGTFDNYYKQFFEFAKKNYDIDWVIKPHQRLYFSIVKNKLMKEDEMIQYFDKWDSLPNAKVINGGDYISIFKSSSLLITDCGSFLAEYLPTLKPCIHLYNKNARYNELGEMIIDAYYRCYSFDEIIEKIETIVLKGEDCMKTKRQEVFKRIIHLEGNAGERILLELERVFN